jgi:uncharacterized protein (TIGR00251 family)
MSFYRWEEKDLILWIHVQPRAKQNRVLGIIGDRLKVKINATPVEGQANAEIGKFFAELFGVAKSQVTILNGHHSRDKRIHIQSPKKCPHFMPVTQ